MGNRALVFFAGYTGIITNPAYVYLHWNGGPESVYTFADATAYLCNGFDDNYSVARFCQVVGQFFGGGSSLGVGALRPADLAAVNRKSAKAIPLSPGDNGIYVLAPNPHHELAAPGGKKWRVVSRMAYKGDKERWFTADEIIAEQDAATKDDYNKDQGLFKSILERLGPAAKGE